MPRALTSRKSGFILRAGVMRRETFWLGIGHNSVALAASATAALTNSTPADILAQRPFTIVRTIINWLAHSDQSAATENYVGNVGYSVVSEQAIAIGISAVPTPATDQGSDMFFLHQSWEGRFELVGADVTTNLVSREVESKAMRKVEDGQDIAFAVEAGIGEAGVTIKTVGRMLIKLH